MNRVKPRIVGFLCNWCSYEGADSAGRARVTYPDNFNVIRLMCAGRIDPQFVMEAFREGADGVMILGCHPGDCHYKEGNFQAMRRYALLKKTLSQFGINTCRLWLGWISAVEHLEFAKAVSEMNEKLQGLDPVRF